MSLGERLNRALAQLLLQQYGSGSDPSRDIITGDSDPDGRPTGEAHPLADQWAVRLDRIISILESDAGMRKATTIGRPSKAELKKVMHGYVGVRPEEVAFWTGGSFQTVRDARRELGLHMAEGYPLSRGERPLTASPRATLETLETK